jgi:hypothetical protein
MTIIYKDIPIKELDSATMVAYTFAKNKGYRKVRRDLKVKFGKFTAHNTRAGNIVILPS